MMRVHEQTGGFLWKVLRTAIFLLSPSAFLFGQSAISSAVGNKGCVAAKQQLIDQAARLTQQVSEDIRALKNLNPAFTTTAASIEDWVATADKAKEEQNKEALDFLKDLTVEGVVKGLKVAADTKLAVYPINADDFIAKYGITSQAGKDLVYKLGLLNVHDPLWFSKVETAINGTKSSYDFTKAKDWTDYSNIVLDVIPAFLKSTTLNANPLLKEAGLLLSDSKFTLAAVIDNVTRRVSLAKIQALASLNERQLQALKSITDLLQHHVQLLNQTKAALSTAKPCSSDTDWQSQLQTQRLNAINAGLIGEYNKLLQQHFAIYRSLGFQPCQSGQYPSGCTKGQVLDKATGKSVTAITASCTPSPANNAIEATHIEASSTHDGCYGRDADGNLFFVANGDPTSYKAVVSGPSPIVGTPASQEPASLPTDTGAAITYQPIQGPNSADPSVRFQPSQAPAVLVQWNGPDDYSPAFLLSGNGALANTNLFSGSDGQTGKSSDGKQTIRFDNLKPGKYVLEPRYTRPRVLPPWWGNDPVRDEAVTEGAKLFGYDPEYQIDVRPGMTTYITPPVACISVEWKGQSGARVAPVSADGAEKTYSLLLSGQQGRNYKRAPGFCASQGHFFLKVASIMSGTPNSNGYPLIPVELRWGQHTIVRLSDPATAIFTQAAFQAEILIKDSQGRIVADAGHAEYDPEWRGHPLIDLFPGAYTLESPRNAFKKTPVEFKSGQITQIQVPAAPPKAPQTKKR